MELPAPSFDGNLLFALPEGFGRKLRRGQDPKDRAAQLLGQPRELPKLGESKTGLSLLALRSGR